ncbi:flagellar filament capping protein FliD [Exiguobacterium sp. B2(2022)]|uniref:flagellar filament capping protein FliD n=1 Tax=Exiguobacterium sp. B2(2022) TaxID=2992755 RepID=UPI00237A9AE2|nr:flagellar filament capping protein FliD [Exiguobacterium sp. B2(2022)]MDE0564776.1 flagellar filament capping protein FliD [Exiguobacterium sp. B2(2022)]
MTTPIRFGGLASGIDTDTIIKQLMQAERAPVDKLEQKKQTTEWKRDAYREINRSLMTLRNSAVDLMFTRNFYAKTASSSDASRVSVVAGPSSGNAALEVSSVSNLATSASHIIELRDKNSNLVTRDTAVKDLNLDASLKNQTVTGLSAEVTLTSKLNDGGKIFVNNAEVDSANYTYDSATEKVTFSTPLNAGDELKFESGYEIEYINKSGGTPAKVSVGVDAKFSEVLAQLNSKDTNFSTFFDDATGKLALTQRNTGSDSIIAFTGGAATFFQASIADDIKGENAIFTVNGIELTRSTNTVTIDNMTITLKAEFPTTQNPTAGAVTLSAATDTQKIFDNIKGFVDKYNETIDLMNKKTREERFRSFAPLTQAQRDELSEDEIKKWEEKAMSGMLRGDSILRGTMDTLRSKWSGATSATPNEDMDFLFQIGLSTGKDVTSGGKIELDEEKLKAAIEKNPEQVYKLFTNAESGLLPQIRDAAAGSRETITRIAGVDGAGAPSYSMGREMTQIDSRIKRLNDLLIDKENAYYRRFAAMETAMNQANSQAASLQQFLGGGM